VRPEPQELKQWARPKDADAYRDRYRGEHIGRRYVGWLHFAFTALGSVAVIGLALSGLRDTRWIELVTVPATFLFANYAEYRGHRYPMHRPMRGLRLIYQRHSLEHHRFFTHQRMAYGSTRDFKIMLFPPVMLLFFIGGLAVPIGALLFIVATQNVACLYVATALGYFLTYELMHFAYHCPERSWVWRVPFMKALRRHHRAHHDPRLMSRHNFNITFPIFDRVFGTTYK